MKKIISSFLIIVSLINPIGTICCAANNDDIINSNKKFEKIIISDEKQLEKLIRTSLLNLSCDKEFIDSLVKNYQNNQKPQKTYFKKVLNLGTLSGKWLLKKILNILKKVLYIGLSVSAIVIISKKIFEKSFLYKIFSKFNEKSNVNDKT